MTICIRFARTCCIYLITYLTLPLLTLAAHLTTHLQLVSTVLFQLAINPFLRSHYSQQILQCDCYLLFQELPTQLNSENIYQSLDHGCSGPRFRQSHNKPHVDEAYKQTGQQFLHFPAQFA